MWSKVWQQLYAPVKQSAMRVWQLYLLPDYEQFKDRYSTLIADAGFWLERQSSEAQRAVKLGLFLVLVMLGYVALWVPLGSVLGEAEAAHQVNVRTLNYLRQHQPVYNHDNEQTLAAALINSARATGIVFSQFQPGEGNTASIAIEGIGFDLLLAWLKNLESLGVARIDALVINSSEDDRKLIVRLTLVGL